MNHAECMHKAVEQALLVGRLSERYSVGCVIVDSSSRALLAAGRTNEASDDPQPKHAEEMAIARLRRRTDLDQIQAVDIYCTMEPCSKRSSSETSCAQLILDLHQNLVPVNSVVCGVLEPTTFQLCEGRETLQRHHIPVYLLSELDSSSQQQQQECASLNTHHLQ